MIRYTEDHEWLADDNGTVSIGITAHAVEQLGDVVFVELPEVGRSFSKGDEIVVIESVKAASGIVAPIDGEIVAVNQALADDPASVNAHPAMESWFIKVKPADPSALDGFMDEAAYMAMIA